MRRIILKEDTTPVNKITASGDLKSFKDLCPEDTQGFSLQSMKLPNETTEIEVLYKKFEGKGYMVIKPDFTFIKYNLDNSEKKENGKGKLAKCPAFNEKITSPMGPQMASAANGLMAKDKSLKRIEDEGVREGIVTGTFVPVDLNSYNEESKKIFTVPNKYFLYKQKGIGGTQQNIPEQVKTWLQSRGWSLDEPDNLEQRKTGQPLVTVLQTLPGGKELIPRLQGEMGININQTKVYKSAEQKIGGVKSFESFKTLASEIKPDNGEMMDVDRQKCRTAVKTLGKMSELYRKNKSIIQYINSGDIDKVTEYVYQCDFKKFLSGGLGVGDEIARLKRDSSPFGLLSKVNASQNQAAVNESTDDYLKSVLRTKLLMLSESKKKSVISSKEYKDYIKTIDEAFNTSGLGNNRINESNILSSVLGIGGEGIIGYFKEKLADSIINKFVPGGSETWLGGMISTTIGNIKVGDYLNGNIFKCEFLVPQLAKSIGENAVRQFADNKGLTGGFYDVLRNSLVELVDDVPFIHKIEEGIGKVLCPSLGKLGLSLSNVFGSIGTGIKQEFTPSK